MIVAASLVAYQIRNVGYLYGVMNHIFSAGMRSFVKHGLVEDQGDLDELLDGSNITLDFFFFILFGLISNFSKGRERRKICLEASEVACTFSPFIASRVVVIDCTALWSVVLVLVEDVGMFAL